MQPSHPVADHWRNEILETMARALCYRLNEDGGFTDRATCESRWRDYLSEIEAALTALADAGYVVVPREPTDTMVRAGGGALKQYLDALPMEERAKLKLRKKRLGDSAGYHIAPRLKCRLRWIAMLEAAGAAPATPTPGISHPQEPYQGQPTGQEDVG
jgi:hypothetical protein